MALLLRLKRSHMGELHRKHALDVLVGCPFDIEGGSIWIIRLGIWIGVRPERPLVRKERITAVGDTILQPAYDFSLGH